MFAERLLGIRIGKYDTNDPTQKDLLVSALRKLGQDTAAVISKDSDIEFVEWLQKAATHQVYGDVAEWVDDQYSVVVLGHTGSSKSTAGRLGNEQAAIEVKQEIVEADAKVLDATINDDIIKVYVDVKYGPQEVYPYHKTDVGRALNLLEEVKIDKGLQDLGFPLTKQYIADKYNRPLPGPDDEILVPPAPASGFGSDPSLSLHASKKKLLRRR
jgi:phage gp29-like protein